MTATASRARALTFLFSILAALVAAFAFSSPALAAEDEGAQPPSISSDKIDYAPGELVTLRGSNWLPGETVNIDVNDDQTQTWRRNVDVVADAEGKIVDSFNLPDWFVAAYTVVASGEVSGTAATSFTDGNVNVKTVGGGGAQATILWSRYDTSDCSGLAGSSGSINAGTSGNGTQIPGGANSGQSLRLTASVISGQAFVNWTRDISTPAPDASNPICVSGTNATRHIEANYATVSNTAPVTANDTYSVNEDASVNVAAPGVLTNDTDADGNSLTAVLVAGPGNGTLTLNANGSFTYTPHANFFGSDSFTYRANDGTANGNVATVSLTVDEVNDAPSFTKGADQTVAEDAAAQSVSGWATAISAGAANESGQALAFSASNDNNGLFLAQPAVAANGTLTFTPAANAHGSAIVTVLLSDDGGTANGGDDTSAAQTFTITVTSVNDAPTCSSGSATTPEDTPEAIDLTCADLDGDSLTYAIVSGPSNGTLTGTGASRTYTPNEDYNGPDSFTFEANDGTVDSAVATFSLTVTPVNDDPIARDDEASVAEDSGANAIDVLVNDDDGPDTGETLTVTAVTQGANGSVTFTATGVTYTPDANFFGSDSFTYTISDGNGGTATAGVDVTVTNVNDDPVANDDAAELAEDSGANAIDVLVNDNDGPDSGETLTVIAVTQGANGSVTFTATGVSYTPGTNFFGLDSFTYTISDGNGGTATATVDVTVTNVNDAPSVAADEPTLTVDEGQPASNTGTWSDIDVDDTVALSASAGAVVKNADGTWSWSLSTSDGPDDGQTITITAEDSAGANATATFELTVANVAPTVTLSGADEVDEGDTETYTYTVTDPGADAWTVDDGYPTCGLNGSLVAGSHEQAVGGGSFDCHFPDGDTSTDVAVRVTDSDGGSDVDSEQVIVVEIANVAPVVVAAEAQSADEGDTKAFDLGSFTDAGAVDGDWSVSVDWGDGSPATAFDRAAEGSIGSQSHTYADGPATHTVTVTVTDKDGGSDSASFEVEVANVAPEADLEHNGPVAEGSDIELELTNPSDPSQADTTAGFEYRFDCGSGYGGWGSSNTASCPTDDNGSRNVKGEIRDKDGDATESTATVTIQNVAPTATLNAPASVDEGSAIALSLTAPSDPSSADTAEGFEYRFDCGSGTGFGPWGLSNTVSCPTNDNGSRDVQAQIRDKDEGVTEYDDTVAVANVAPTATFSNDGPANEGSSFTLSLTDAHDVSSIDAAAGFTYAFDCGAGGGYGAYGSSNTASCPTTDNGNRNVKGKIRDKDGGEREYTATVVVNNLDPSVTITSPAVGTLYTMGSTVSVAADFSDLGSGDTHTCVISWDNGLGTTAGTVNEANGSGTCTGSKQLTQSGVYTIRVTVTDDDGGSGFDETLVVVYDPNVGHVTGGGWINSPAGAYRADPTLEGRANFGFNAKYQKGAKTPTGSTEFQFKAGSLNFHSTIYEWLVVAGAKGQFKGTGTINGAGSYGFLLTVTDGQLSGGGGTDKFRIKIWDKNAADAIVYDNASAGGDDIDTSSTQEIAGGSIVIHKGK